MTSLAARSSVPWTVTAAIAGTFVLLAGHLFALVYPPHVLADIFHVVWGAAFCGLAVLLRSPRNWVRVLLSGLIAIQFVGKGVVVHVGGPRRGARADRGRLGGDDRGVGVVVGPGVRSVLWSGGFE
ncbi:hypothetical protein [Actinomadura meridiana]